MHEYIQLQNVNNNKQLFQAVYTHYDSEIVYTVVCYYLRDLSFLANMKYTKLRTYVHMCIILKLKF